MPEKKSTETEVERNKRRIVPPRKIDPSDTDEPTLPDDPAKDDDEEIFKPLDRQKP
ncbi:hypothetical protein OG946_14250 [Streptomyces sp. NBC_01808]|uniref:hypothetical protein n=1 Tax=Streptomyces sp. NBC_01808 TaxID=2975947 RepID=UPI002DDC7A7F|nr:hypothetical protein [Streptomyces sp. NBC_01808]WSA38435.1 hypothetical protein OG946_14250 [Streptomyces sp. NBC_01808]